jgi:hypothetical protein
MPKWKALLVLGAIGAIGGLLLWFGLVIVVRADRVHHDRVDVTLERRFLGLVTLSSETVPDVIEAGIEVVSSRGSSGRYSSTVALELTPREGPPVRRGQFGPAVGTKPYDASQQITQFLKEPSRPSFTTWWMPWLVNVGSLPFVLIIVGVLGENLLRALGFFKAGPDS